MAVLETGPADRQLAMAYSNRSQLHALGYEFEDALAWGERARSLAARLGDMDTAIRATEVHSTVTGDIDLNGILGLNPSVRNGYHDIAV